jgi:hypothetical protein
MQKSRSIGSSHAKPAPKTQVEYPSAFAKRSMLARYVAKITYDFDAI